VKQPVVFFGIAALGLALAQTAFPRTPAADGKAKIIGLYSLEPTGLTAMGYSADALAAAQKNGLKRTDLPAIGSGLVWLGGTQFMGITDRGPNEDHLDKDGKVDGKTFPLPTFAPTMVRFTLEGNAIKPLEYMPITATNGKPITGLSTEAKDDVGFINADSRDALGFDPNGLDTEALQRLPDGRWMIADEYSPSIAVLSAKGQVLMRYTPEGKRLSGAGYPVQDILPAVFENRRGNRGFENLAVSSDGKTAWAILQSPMGATSDKLYDESRIARAVHLDISDPLNAKVTAMYVVPMSAKGDYKDTKRQRDLKYSDAAWLGAEKLLLLERADKLVKLFVVDFALATNLLERPEGATLTPESVETKLETLGIKTPSRVEVFSSAGLIDDDKLEGIAVLSPGTVAITNDNDFGIGDNKTGAPSKLWIVQLAQALPR
jgi:hypothetical protein